MRVNENSNKVLSVINFLNVNNSKLEHACSKMISTPNLWSVYIQLAGRGGRTLLTNNINIFGW